MIGNVKGQTVLPLPVEAPCETTTARSKAKEKIHILENSIVTWGQQIKKVLKANPDAALKVLYTHFFFIGLNRFVERR